MKKVAIFWHMYRLKMLLAIGCFYTVIARSNYEQEKLSPIEYIFRCRKMFRRVTNKIGAYRREFIYTKHIILDGHGLKSMKHILYASLFIAWLCEKMKVNLRIEGLSDFFSNDLIINNVSEYRKRHFKNTKRLDAGPVLRLAGTYMRSKHGKKVLSKFLIREDIKKCADEWFANHIKGDWVAVHFRGTDCNDKKMQLNKRCGIKLSDYIVYLQAVLNKKYSILACSDQAQFIDEMHTAFPGRVFARDIQRSYDNRSLHKYQEYKGVRQKKDALTDMLILAKADLVYTTGSGFIDALRFLNPEIKIVSLDERWLAKRFSIGIGSHNGVPIPRNDLLEKFRKSYQSDL